MPATAKRNKPAAFTFKPFSDKQLKVLTWWMSEVSPHHDKDAIICDGSVRAGKTIAMSLSYVMWGMDTFNGENLGMAGKTIGALRRNVIAPLKRMLKARGYQCKEHRDLNYITISRGGVNNDFYLFGGKDERSQDLIQGITLAGMFFDEVALMPESFVNQATARCSVDGSKYWFNCNPAGPYHWFKLKWLDQLEQKNAFHLHFTMDDNLSLSDRVKRRYRNQYTGVFFKRFILGLWVVAEGAIYDMWDILFNTFDDGDMPEGYKYTARRYVPIDYGTQNATVFLDIWDDGDTVWVFNEYYHSGRETSKQKDDAEYAEDLVKFVGEDTPRYNIIDPSAASFKVAVRNRGLRVMDADNDVLEGIRKVSTLIAQRKLRVHRRNCPNLLKEVASYAWDEKATLRGEEKPIKQNDHACFVAGTLIETINGQVPIEDIQVGDLVLTRDGYHPVTDCGITALDAEVMTVYFSHGSQLTGTKNHPIFVENKGFSRLDSLRYDDIINVSPNWEMRACQGLRLLFMKGIGTGGIQLRKTNLMRGISNALSTVVARLNTCIKGFGTTIMEPFQKIITSITKTTIPQTTTSTTWNVCPASNTYLDTANSIRRVKNIIKKWWRSPKYGTGRNKATNGISNIGINRCGKHSQRELKFATNAGMNLNTIPHLNKQDSARTIANPLGEENQELIMKPEIALSVAKNSQLINIADRKPVQGNAVESLRSKIERRKTAVYNIAVSSCPEYYANGVLVHNCDALRYFVSTIIKDRRIHPR